MFRMSAEILSTCAKGATSNRSKMMKFREIEKYARSLGFFFVRKCDGSHKIFENKDGIRAIVSEHSGETPPHLVKKLFKGVNNGIR